jgi:hypothetical protein
MLHHCLHHFTQEFILSLFSDFERLFPKLKTISVLEPTLSIDGISPPENAVFSFYMTMNRANGRVHNTDWLDGNLRKQGFSVERTDIAEGFGDTWLLATR